ncbi:MAG TPA: aminotransferase class I/II-fold pyridoxal phosphate-dependent enzyme, partial [Candidatus Binatus sp.]|nr:aminotransferase class I/II-fold pyridoxal phosphate-dependent enzyme [Candidatus Binatus sp.]
GYIIAEKRLTAGIRKVHDFLTVCAPTPLQEGCLQAMKLPRAYYDTLVSNYDTSRKLLLKVLRSVGFECLTPEGAYYVWTKIDGTGFKDDRKLAEYLINEVGVGAVPGSSFYRRAEMGSRRLRFSFSKTPKTIRNAASRLAKMKRVPN